MTEKIDTDRAVAHGGAAIVQRAFAESPVLLTAKEQETIAGYMAAVQKGEALAKPSGATLSYEQGMIGRLLNDRAAFDEVADLIRVEHFADDAHRAVLAAFIELDGRRRAVDQTALVEYLNRHAQAKLDWFAILAACQKADTQTPTMDKALAVFGGWRRRRLMALGAALYARATASGVFDGEEILTDIGDRLSDLERPTDASIEDMGIGEAVKGMAKDVQRRHSLKGENSLPGMPSGWPRLDWYIGGWVPGNLVVVKAGTGHGKTAFALSAMVKSALRCQNDRSAPNVGSVAIISLEMECATMALRYVANVGSVDAQALRLATVDGAQIDNIVRATRDAARLDDIFRLVYRPGLSVNALARLVRRLQRRPGVPPLRLLVIDYLQLLSAPGCGNNREQEIAQISAALTLIAKRENLCVMALSQMNADGQARESRKIEQDADVVMTLKPTDPDNETPDTNAVYDVLVQKNRHGLTTGAGKWRMVFSKRFQRFHEVEGEGKEKPRNNWRGEEERED